MLQNDVNGVQDNPQWLTILGCDFFPLHSGPCQHNGSQTKHLLYRFKFITWTTSKVVGQDSVDSIATRCRLDSPGIESRWGRDFLHLTRLALGPT